MIEICITVSEEGRVRTDVYEGQELQRGIAEMAILGALETAKNDILKLRKTDIISTGGEDPDE